MVSKTTSYQREPPTMSSHEENLVEKRVTYTLEFNGRVFVVENVPARVNEETGEQFFSPSTVEHLQKILLAAKEPDRFAEVPVYNYAA
jgi:YgiT-type zinc finger domain-containing protein